MKKAKMKKAKTKAKRRKKYYSLLNAKGEEIGVFSGRYPRAAAIKAAKRGHMKIRLREHRKLKDGSVKIHVYEGSRRKVDAPKLRWFEGLNKVWKGFVKKVKTEKMVKTKAKTKAKKVKKKTSKK